MEALLYKFIYGFIVNNKNIKIIEKIKYIGLNIIFVKIYISIIYKIYALLYNIKLNIKFISIFSFW